MYESQVKNLTPEFERDARQYFEEGFGRAFHSKKTTQLRIVPVNRQIAVERNVTTYDQIRAHVETSPGPFATIMCICRHGRDLVGESCKQTKVRDNCLMINGAGDQPRGDAGPARPSRQGRAGSGARKHRGPHVCVLLLRVLLRRGIAGD